MDKSDLKLDEATTMIGLIRAATWQPEPVHRRRLAAYRPVFDQVAAESGIDSEMLQAIALVESNLDPSAKNPEAPAYGMMQLWEPTWFGTPLTLEHGPTVAVNQGNWSDPLTNVRAGAAILTRYGATDSETSWWDTLNDYNGDQPPRDAEYEADVQVRYFALLRDKLLS